MNTETHYKCLNAGNHATQLYALCLSLASVARRCCRIYIWNCMYSQYGILHEIMHANLLELNFKTRNVILYS